MNAIVFSEVGAINDRGYVTCDCCHRSGLEDTWNREELRAIYFMEPDGLYVCEHCLGEIDL